MEILTGIFCGLILSLFFSFGPGFWGLIQNSIHYGFKKGVAFEAGVNFSDIVMVVLLLTILNTDSITNVLRTPVAAIIGGSIVIIFGIVTMTRRNTVTVENKGRIRVVLRKAPRYRELVFYGFTLNTVNPGVWLYWIAMTAIVKAEVNFNDLEIFMFFISMLLAELAGGILKCHLASMMKRILSPRLLTIINYVMGSILIALGGYLIINMIIQVNHPERNEPEPTAVVSHIIHQTLHSKDSIQQDTLYLQ